MARRQPLHVVWHRADLRAHDHPALHAALQEKGLVVPLVIIDKAIFARRDLTPRRQAHFLENVRALREKYRALGTDLLVRRGDIVSEWKKLLRELKNVASVHAIRTYTPYAKERDERVRAELEKHGVEWHSHGGQYTHEPGTVFTQQGTRFSVFGAYRRQWMKLPPPTLHLAPKRMASLPRHWKRGEIPRVDPGIKLPPAGEDAALDRLAWFLKNGEKSYEKTRDEPGREASTSRLSYYFNLGVLSPRLAYHRARTEKWRAELTWWDFYAEVLDRAPQSAHEEYRENWLGFPWRSGEDKSSKSDLERWRQGETGYPLVDAGMRELQQTGFMQNRVRMVCASFLCKHLLIDWRVGEEIFRGLLLCGDRSQNVGNWQWVAGCGTDAAPYFRIFNPTSQGKKYDPQGEYVRRWIPALRDVPKRFVYEPWKLAPPPRGYDHQPVVELAFGRDRFARVARKFLANATDSPRGK